MLTTAQQQQYERDGYLVLPDFKSAGEIAALRARAGDIVAAGSLVGFHGLLPHHSAPNRSPESRHAYTLHATDGRTTYSPQNWIQRDAALPVRGLL